MNNNQSFDNLAKSSFSTQLSESTEVTIRSLAPNSLTKNTPQSIAPIKDTLLFKENTNYFMEEEWFW